MFWVIGAAIVSLAAVAIWWHRRQRRKAKKAQRARDAQRVRTLAPPPLPGQLVQVTHPNPSPSPYGARTVKVVSWNIERGQQLQKIIQELRAVNADIVLLQEVDYDCSRSGCCDVGHLIAEALGMHFVFVNEMDYVDTEPESHPFRTDATACAYGSEGNAILSRFPIEYAASIPLQCVRNRFRKNHSAAKRHSAPLARIRTPLGLVTAVSVHLDAFAGRVARATQFQTVLRGVASEPCPVVVGGDLNTHNHGIARLVSGLTGDDPFRWSHWGRTEAQWWQQYVMDTAANTRGLQDPFDKVQDVTTTIGAGLVFRGKIDWLFASRELVCRQPSVSTDGGNGASDHSYLTTLIELRDQ